MSEPRSILDIIDAHLASSDLKLPTYSPVAARIQALAERADTDIRHIEQAILQDPALAGEVLRVANSALYAGLAKVASIDQAIARLGTVEVVNLVVACTQAGAYRAGNPTIQAWMNTLWQHAMGTALGARWLAERCGYRDRAAEAFLGGLFHDIGKLLLLKVFDDLDQAAETRGRFSQALMAEVLVAQHAEQGARLLTHWNLAQMYVDLARQHHAQPLDECNPLAAIVRLADQACTKLGLNLVTDPNLVLTATAEAGLLGLSDIVIAELEITLEDGMQTLARAA